MQTMNLTEWKKLTVPERKQWMSNKTPRDLLQLLVMIGEMLEQADQWDAELSMLIEPSSDITDARDSVYNALRSVEHYITMALNEKKVNISTM